MRLGRKGVSTTVAVAILVVAVLVVGGGFYAYSSLPQRGGTSPSTTTSSSSSVSSTSGSSFRLVMQLHPGTPLASSDVVANYTLDVTILGSLDSPLTFGYAGPTGLVVEFQPATVQAGSGSAEVAVSFRASDSLVVGILPFNVTAQSGGQKFSEGFQVQVVKYLVVTVGTTFLPQSVSVPVGSAVYWVRLNGAIDQYDNGDHNVSFGSLGVTSPTLARYDSWSYVFNQVGTFNYDCTFHASMTGQVVVS